jgi:hypothetical protein
VPLARLGPWVLDTERALLSRARGGRGDGPGRAQRGGHAHRACLPRIRTSEVAAQASGINAAAYKTAAFVLSAFYTGVAGGLFAFVVGFLSPDAFDVFLSVDFLVMIILGGLGSVWGSVAGGRPSSPCSTTRWPGSRGGGSDDGASADPLPDPRPDACAEPGALRLRAHPSAPGPMTW